MNIIPAQINHLLPLVDLFDAYRVWYRKPSDRENAYRFLMERLLKEESMIYLAEANHGEFCGFVQLYPLFSSTRMKRLWLLNDLFVQPEFRGQGISKLLITRAKKLAKDTSAAGLLLETEKSNMIGNQLYPNTGFELETEINYYFWASI